MEGVFFGICQYGYTTEGGIYVTDNFYISDGWLWPNELAVANEKFLNPTDSHYNVETELSAFFNSLEY